MKINKTKSPLAPGTVDAPDEKDIARAVKGEKFAETLSALEASSVAGAEPSAARTALTAIAAQYDLSDEESRRQALLESAEFLVKSRLSEKYKQADKAISDLREYIAEDPFLKAKLLSVLEKLSGA
jgi:hypothetical protein